MASGKSGRERLSIARVKNIAENSNSPPLIHDTAQGRLEIKAILHISTSCGRPAGVISGLLN